MTGHPYRLQSLCLLALVAMPGTASALQFHTPHSDPIAPVLLGVTGILFMALLGRFGARKLQLPSVLGELGMGLGGGDDPQPEDYQRVLRSAKNRDDASVIQSVLLRSMSQAVYQAENLGHFGLAFEGYTHFTSPIRRYADLLVHRAIRSLIRNSKKVSGVVRVEGAKGLARAEIYPYELPRLDETGAHLSVTERRADEATRDVVNWLKCEYLVDRVGEEYPGVVTAVTGFGLFVMLDELYVEGLVHVTGLPKDYYYHEAAQHRMVGERTGRVFRLGDKLKVKVVRVNLDERKIDFELSGQENSSNNSGAKRPAGKITRKQAGKPAGKSSRKTREQDSKHKPKGKKKRGAGARSGAGGKDKPSGSKRRRNAPKAAGQANKGAGSGRTKVPKS